MQEIIFATSNSGKVKTLVRRLGTGKYKITQKEIDIPEIQANSARDIAAFKAEYAYEKLNQPIIVQDSSFHIHALHGFPGPYIKFVNETIGPYGLTKLMEGVKDRSCHFELALAYADGNGVHTFVYETKPGTLAESVYEGNSENAWSSLWKIYQPQGYSKVLAALTPEELKHMETSGEDNSEFAQFIGWLEQRHL